MSRAPLILSAQVEAGASMADPTFALAVLHAAEAAGIDLLVLGASPESAAAVAFDPLIVAAWLAPHARGVGLITAVSALHSEPFHVARALSALDFLTAGRCGWLPTMAAVDWSRFGGVGEVRPEQYLAKSRDLIAATQSLWDSWDSDALIIEPASGAYLHADRVRRSNYSGPYHQVQGPLNAARPPQGHPLLVQADIELTNGSYPNDIQIVSAHEVLAPGVTKTLVRIDVHECRDSGLAALARRWEDGAIAGIHLTLSNPLAELELFRDRVLPELRRLGRVTTALRENSLRARFGLPVPRSAAEIARRGMA
jgi:alkanesulfonate monooxygenase SsuD/methylene tetrahydromethanopterin reductase-like flavin-dependent oxidoreductase (luciferase family)